MDKCLISAKNVYVKHVNVSPGSKCECKDPEDCSDDSAHLCVSLMGGASEMVSECEGGAWRCQGKNITVLSIGHCQA